MMKMFGYWRSGTAYRARLALAFKGIEVESIPIDLSKGEQHSDAYKQANPSAAVPTLVLEDGTHIAQSTAIIEYLEDRFPEPSLMPLSAKGRARVRQLAGIIGYDIHPLQNLRVQKYLREQLDQPQSEVEAWMNNWMGKGLAAFESHLEEDLERGVFCYGGKPGFTECFLLPQLYSARRFGVPLDSYKNILAVEEAAMSLDFVKKAHPDNQPEAVK